MTNPKIPKDGQSIIPLKIHTVKNPQGKSYSYRAHKIFFWLTEDEIKSIERTYNYVKTTRRQKFSDKECSSLSKFLKAVCIKYSKMINSKYID